jgi:hypothetical protein
LNIINLLVGEDEEFGLPRRKELVAALLLSHIFLCKATTNISPSVVCAPSTNLAVQSFFACPQRDALHSAMLS